MSWRRRWAERLRNQGKGVALLGLEQQKKEYDSKSILSPGQIAKLPPDRVDPLYRDELYVKKALHAHSEKYLKRSIIEKEERRREYEGRRPIAYGMLALGTVLTMACGYVMYRLSKTPAIEAA